MLFNAFGRNDMLIFFRKRYERHTHHDGVGQHRLCATPAPAVRSLAHRTTSRGRHLQRNNGKCQKFDYLKSRQKTVLLGVVVISKIALSKKCLFFLFEKTDFFRLYILLCNTHFLKTRHFTKATL
jgi:hypothetical protein